MDNYEYMSDEWIDNFNKPRGKDSFFEFTDMNNTHDPELNDYITYFKNMDPKKFRDKYYDKENSSWKFNEKTYPTKNKASKNIEEGKKPISEVLDKDYVSDEQKLMGSVANSIEQKSPITDYAKNLSNKISKDSGLPYKESGKEIKDVENIASDKVTVDTVDGEVDVPLMTEEEVKSKLNELTEKYKKYHADDPIYRSAIHALTSDYLTPREKASLFGSIIANLVANISASEVSSLENTDFKGHPLPWNEKYRDKVLENAAASDSKIRNAIKTAEADYSKLIKTFEGAEKAEAVINANPGIKDAILDYIAMNPDKSYKDMNDLMEKAGVLPIVNSVIALKSQRQLAAGGSDVIEETNRGKQSNLSTEQMELATKKIRELTDDQIELAKAELLDAIYKAKTSGEITEATYNNLKKGIGTSIDALAKIRAETMYGKAQWDQNAVSEVARLGQQISKGLVPINELSNATKNVVGTFTEFGKGMYYKNLDRPPIMTAQ